MRLPFEITICGMGDLMGIGQDGVTHVLSILDPGAPLPRGLDAFEGRRRLLLRFDDVIEEGQSVQRPEAEHMACLLNLTRDILDGGRGRAHLLIHCHAGFSRSPAAAILVLAKAMPERSATELHAELLRIRPNAWPNLRMIELGDQLLGRNGEIITATHQLHRYQLERDPSRLQLMLEVGRAREIEGALSTQSAAQWTS